MEFLFSKVDVLNYTKQDFTDFKFFATAKTTKNDSKTIENLKNLIASVNVRKIEKFKDYFVMLNERQKENIKNCVFSLEKALQILKDRLPIDIFGVILRKAIEFLLELTGEKVCDLVLEDIFSKFCVGK